MIYTLPFRCLAILLSILLVSTPLLAQFPEPLAQMMEDESSPDEQQGSSDENNESGQIYAPASQEPPAQVQQAEPTAAPRISLGDVEEQAKMDARADSKGGVWFVVGCLLGCIGPLIAYLIEPNPQAMRLVGQSPEYVAAYTDAYKKQAKSQNAKQAFLGCLVGTAISVGLQLMFMTL